MKKFWLASRDIIVILLLVIAAQVIPQLVLGTIQFIEPAMETNHVYILTALILMPLCYLFLFYYGFIWLKKHLYHNNFTSLTLPIRLKKQYWGYSFLMIGILLCGSAVVGLHLVTPSLNNWEFKQNLVSNGLMFFVAPFVEEFTFRGVIIEQITKRYNLITGIIISSLLFGLVHLMNGPLDFFSAVQLVLSGTLMGCLLSLAYVYENSIWANYTIHASYNLFFTVVPIQTSITHDWPFQLIFAKSNQFITGGQYGSDCSLAFNIAYLLMIVLFLYLMNKKRQSKLAQNN